MDALFRGIGHHLDEILPGGIVDHGEIAPIIVQETVLITNECTRRVPKEIGDDQTAARVFVDDNHPVTCMIAVY